MWPCQRRMKVSDDDLVSQVDILANGLTDVKPFRRVLVLVNPVGGKGKAKAIVRDTVLALLEAAGCVVETRGMLVHFLSHVGM